MQTVLGWRFEHLFEVSGISLVACSNIALLTACQSKRVI